MKAVAFSVLAPVRRTAVVASLLFAFAPALFLSGGTAAAGVQIERDVQYGEAGGEKLLMDVYRPEQAAPGDKRPAVLLIHGGGWQGGSRTAPSMTAIGNALAEAGIVAFNIDYRLVKAGPKGQGHVNQYPAAIDDCRTAVRWVRQHADELGVDAARLGACGDSAGGHLVSMLGVGGGAADSRVQAVVDIFGPADLTSDYSKFQIGTINVQQLVDEFVSTPEQKAEASPLKHIDDQTAAFLIFHGAADPLVPVVQSRDFHAALLKAGRSSELVEFPDAGHGFAGDDFKTMVDKTVQFFSTQLKGDGAATTATTTATPPAPAPAPAQDLGALFRMHYANRVRSFAEQNLMLQNVVLLGDSITEGFETPKFLPGRRVLNRGIGADVIGNDLPADDRRGVLKRMNESIFHCSATDVFLMIGINDLGAGRTPDQMEPGYREILQQVKTQAPAVRVHVQSLLPCRDRYIKHNANVLDFNARIKKLAAEFGYDYIDLHTLMADDKGELKAELTNDGLHINAAGYDIWKVEVARAMQW